ncbi:MAG: DNA primase [Eubacterium sp.]|nr:DNA primase [Eubacterium sp.]
MYYSDDIVEEVRTRNDIVEVISEYTGLKRSGNTYKCCCPFHNEKTPSFTVSKEKQMYHCFGCHVGGNVYTFIMKYENMSFPEAVQHLARRAGIQLPEEELSEADKRKKSRRERLFQVNRSAAAYFYYMLTKTERGQTGYEYLKKRGYSDETINRFAMGFADIYSDDLYKYLKSKNYTDDEIRSAGLVKYDERHGARDQFYNRVMVPILDLNENVVGFGGRVLDDSTPKYLNTRETEIFNKGRLLFAMQIARHSRRKGIILCEGYMDVIAMHQAGFDNAVASLGTAFTEGQAGLIKRYTTDVYLAYDSDVAGTKAAMRAIGILRHLDMKQKVIDLRPYKDPDEFIKNMGVDAFEERVKNAQTGRIFEIEHIVANYDLNNPEEKTEFMKAAGRLLAGIPDITERTNYIESIASKYFLNKDELKRIVTEVGLAGLAEEGLASYMEPDIVDNTNRQRDYQNGKKREDINPYEENEKYLLTLMVNNIELFDKLGKYISENDFTEGVVKEVAGKIFAQYRESGNVVPASILSSFEDAEAQEKVSEIFTKEFEFDTTPSMREKILTDIIIKIKTNNIDKALKSGQGVNRIELAKQKAELKKIKINL